MNKQTPIVDGCTKSADRYGDADVVPASVARKLESALRKIAGLPLNLVDTGHKAITIALLALEDD